MSLGNVHGPWCASGILDHRRQLDALAAVLTLFGRLVVNVAAEIASPSRPRPAFRYAADVDLDELQATYQEYLAVPGFDEEKERLRRYLERSLAAQGAGLPRR